MNIDELAEKAEANFHKHLVENSYPGRGIVIGCDPGVNPVLTVSYTHLTLPTKRIV